MKCYRRCSGTLAGTERDSSDSRVGGPAFNGNKWVWIQRDPLRVGHFDTTGARETRSEYLKCEMLKLEACVTNVTLSRLSRDIWDTRREVWWARTESGCDYLGQRFYTRLEKEVMGKSLIKYWGVLHALGENGRQKWHQLIKHCWTKANDRPVCVGPLQKEVNFSEEQWNRNLWKVGTVIAF